MEHDSMKLNLG